MAAKRKASAGKLVWKTEKQFFGYQNGKRTMKTIYTLFLVQGDRSIQVGVVSPGVDRRKYVGAVRNYRHADQFSFIMTPQGWAKEGSHTTLKRDVAAEARKTIATWK